MGIDYTIYTEAYIKDRWYNIDSYVLAPSGKFRLAPLLDGRSFVREYQYEYYAPRYEVVAFETGENEEISEWLTRESYEELPAEEQKEYVFFKWTEPYGWYATLSKVITRVETRLADYSSEVSFGEEGFYEYLYDKTVPMRLVVEIH